MKIYLVIQEANGVPHTPDGVWFMHHGAFLSEYKAEDKMKDVMKKEGISRRGNKFLDEDDQESQWNFDVWEVDVWDA
jgi:hypothetical protein